MEENNKIEKNKSNFLIGLRSAQFKMIEKLMGEVKI
jgi:hypothetical protein